MKDLKNLFLVYLMIIFSVLAVVHWCNCAVTVFAEKSPPIRSGVVVIDPGHGGVDGGAISCTGVPESKINLEISICLNDLLHFLGHETKMIRNEDISVYTSGNTIAQKKISDLKERVRIVNNIENAILLSIHQNKFTDSRYSGIQVFFSDAKESQKLAEELQRAFLKYLKHSGNRKEKKSNGIYLMEHIHCPAILVECGFLSNPEEEARLRNKEYQQKICSIIACTAGAYVPYT